MTDYKRRLPLFVKTETSPPAFRQNRNVALLFIKPKRRLPLFVKTKTSPPAFCKNRNVASRNETRNVDLRVQTSDN